MEILVWMTCTAVRPLLKKKKKEKYLIIFLKKFVLVASYLFSGYD